MALLAAASETRHLARGSSGGKASRMLEAIGRRVEMAWGNRKVAGAPALRRRARLLRAGIHEHRLDVVAALLRRRLRLLVHAVDALLGEVLVRVLDREEVAT